MKTRILGAGKLEVSAIGFGCMGLSHGYGPVPERADSIKLIRQAFDLGCNFFDTAEGYGAGHNEDILGEAIRPFRDRTILATKFATGFDLIDGKCCYKRFTPEQIREHLEDSLRRLRTDYVDLYYEHRVCDDNVEEVAACMGDLIAEGKIRAWGQSQSTSDQIRRAHAITPLTAVQSEYSMMERMFEKEVIPTCDELGIGFVPFSPLASGFLTGKNRLGEKYVGDDVRRVITRFKNENVAANMPLIELLHLFAERKNATPAQISLAWMLHKYDFLVPIPGTKKLSRLQENLGAADVELTHDEFEQLETELKKIQIHGNRTDEDIVLGLRGENNLLNEK